MIYDSTYRSGRDGVRVCASGNNIFLVTEFRGGQDIAAVAIFAEGVDMKSADDLRPRRYRRDQKCAVQPAQGRDRNIRSNRWARNLREGTSTDRTISVIVYDRANSTSSSREGCLETKFTGTTFYQGDFAGDCRGEVGLKSGC